VGDIPSINLSISDKLSDQYYRRNFFLAEASASIAGQLAALRKLRGLKQVELAELVGTQQSGISRIERADYRNWSFSTLWKIVEVLDARLRVVIEPTEAVLHEYEDPTPEPKRSSALDRLTTGRPPQPARLSALEHFKPLGSKNEASKYRSKPGGIPNFFETHEGAAVRG
jgi:transcriptional regulator with XRE-family HTH domain